MDKKNIFCGFKNGYQIFQENLNRLYEPMEMSLNNFIISETPNNCESGDFLNDMFH